MWFGNVNISKTKDEVEPNQNKGHQRVPGWFNRQLPNLILIFLKRWLLFNMAIFGIYLSNFGGGMSQPSDFSEVSTSWTPSQKKFTFRTWLFQVVVNGHPGHWRTRGTLHGPKAERGSSCKWGLKYPMLSRVISPQLPISRAIYRLFLTPFIKYKW